MKSNNENLKSVTKDEKINMNLYRDKNDIKMGDNIFERNTSANADVDGMNNNGFLPLKGELPHEKEKKEEKEEEDLYMSVMRPLQYDETPAFTSYHFR